MRILPVTNTCKNISHNGKLTFATLFLCDSQRDMWKRELGGISRPEDIKNYYGCIVDHGCLDEACEKMFAGKTAQEIQQIREKYKKQAEDNFKQLADLIHNWFSEHCFLNIRKLEGENCPHAIMNSSRSNYVHDFGEVELSDKHNNFSDIDSITKLVNKIKSLTEPELKAINEKFEPPAPPISKTDDAAAAAAGIILVGTI